MLQIPDHIPKPDYYVDGNPISEVESRQQHSGAANLLSVAFTAGWLAAAVTLAQAPQMRLMLHCAADSDPH